MSTVIVLNSSTFYLIESNYIKWTSDHPPAEGDGIYLDLDRVHSFPGWYRDLSCYSGSGCFGPPKGLCLMGGSNYWFYCKVVPSSPKRIKYTFLDLVRVRLLFRAVPRFIWRLRAVVTLGCPEVYAQRVGPISGPTVRWFIHHQKE